MCCTVSKGESFAGKQTLPENSTLDLEGIEHQGYQVRPIPIKKGLCSEYGANQFWWPLN